MADAEAGKHKADAAHEQEPVDAQLPSQAHDEAPEGAEEEGKKIKQLTLRLPEEYHRKLKILAACSGKSMTEILVGCIDERLEHCLEKELKKVK